MRAGSRVFAVLLAAAVWIYAGMSVASRPVAFQAIAPSALDAAVAVATCIVD